MITSNDIEEALAIIQKRTANYEYFFNKLDDPEWIKPLYEKGMFQNPPDPVPSADANYISFPIWPESRFLSRMAEKAPEVVQDILLKMPDTANVRVHEDILDAALAMPPTLSVKILPKAKSWIKNKYQLLLPRKLGELISHLATGGQENAALDLAKTVLLPATEKTRAPLSREPLPYFAIWDYEHILEKNVPDLVMATEEEALKLLCDMLETSIGLYLEKPDEAKPHDLSYIWRPAAEEHKQNRKNGIMPMLVSAIRDAAEQVINSNPEKMHSVVATLECRPWKIYKRLALYILNRFPQLAPELVRKRLTDKEYFEDSELKHEYSHLLRDQFDTLEEKTREIILTWLEKGLDREEVIQISEARQGHKPTEEQIKRSRLFWLRDWLFFIHGAQSLSAAWRTKYQELVAEIGQPQHPDFPYYMHVGWAGPTSPLSRVDLQRMSIDELIIYLKTWVPSGEFMDSTAEGLGRELDSIVAAESENFSASAEKFIGLDATYIRHLLQGITEAAKQKKQIHWVSIIDLCKWILEQPRETPGRSSKYLELDPGWGWTRKEIARLLESGFEENKSEVPIRLREDVWRILRPLTDDPDPEDKESSMDPITYSFNCVRGEAMHAAIRYGLWVRRHIEKADNGKERLRSGFNEIPELRDVLERHLDPTQDSSLAIRAVYGQWLPFIYLMDKEWLIGNLRRIFPLDTALVRFRATAWTAYIIYCRPYDDVFIILRDEYNWAIDNCDVIRTKLSFTGADSAESLANHLMVYYWHGRLRFDEDDRLLERFFENAPQETRRDAIGFIGRNLGGIKEDIPEEEIKRLKLLWEKRIHEARSAPDLKLFTSELAEFGWWFISLKFDEDWTLEQLKTTLGLTGKVKPDHLVVGTLSNLADKRPLDAVECLELLVEGAQEDWAIYSWKDEARTLLRNVLQSADRNARSKAEDLVHKFGSRGFIEFRELLE